MIPSSNSSFEMPSNNDASIRSAFFSKASQLTATCSQLTAASISRSTRSPTQEA